MEVTQSLEAFLKLDKVVFGCCSAAADSDPTATGELMHFPQLDPPVEPDDGAERERQQHTSSKQQKADGWVLLQKPSQGSGLVSAARRLIGG